MKKFYALCIFLTALCVLLSSCTDNPPRRVTPAFYHWQTALDLSDFEKNYLQAVGADKLYVKFFDVDRAGDFAAPQAILQIKNEVPPTVRIIPVIFITNRTFQHLNAPQIKELATKTVRKIRALYAGFAPRQPEEIQFDCDWSESTRVAYFSFLKAVKAELADVPVRLSATIRLHQIKYRERTGVPPVGRGMLMFYNTGKVTDPATENSILDLKTAGLYTDRLAEYPLALDLVLPLFRWGVLFREGKMIRLLNNLTETEMQDTTYFTHTDARRFAVRKNTYLAGHYVYKKDTIRLERVRPELLRKTADLLAPIFPAEDFSLAFYHIDSMLTREYAPTLLQEVNETFGRADTLR